MCFVDPRPPLLPEAKPRTTTVVEKYTLGLYHEGVSYTGGGLIYGQHLVLVLHFIVPVNYIVNSLSQNILMTNGKHTAK